MKIGAHLSYRRIAKQYEFATTITVAPDSADLLKEGKGNRHEETKRKRLRRSGASAKRARGAPISVLAAFATENRNKGSSLRTSGTILSVWLAKPRQKKWLPLKNSLETECMSAHGRAP